jgi:N6-adenosine-specific RNA methylase IME4
MLMVIARDSRLVNTNHGSLLPTEWRTIYEIAQLTDYEFQEFVADGTINPEMTRSDLAMAKRLLLRDSYVREIEDGCTVDDLDALAATGKRFGVIYADPPWEFKVYSGKGKQRSADRYYDTASLDAIKALPVEQLAAADCSLFLWCVMPELRGALAVIESWGFAYKTAGFTWVKQNKGGEGLFTGMGYWTRANAELCLFATRGSPQRLAMDVPQVILAPVSEHSEKPDEARRRIERLLAGPYLELYGRRSVDGWWVWGNQIEREEFDATSAA